MVQTFRDFLKMEHKYKFKRKSWHSLLGLHYYIGTFFIVQSMVQQLVVNMYKTFLEMSNYLKYFTHFQFVSSTER